MKLLICALFFTLTFALDVPAQSVKTEPGKRLKEVKSLITQIEKEIKAKSEEITALLMKYTPEYTVVQQVKSEISKLNETLLALQSEKKELLNQKLIKDLPNNQVELLKILIVQNEIIIDLLESLKKP